MRLAGKVAIVTGGGSGIGRGIVLALAREGADVAIPDIQVLNAEKVAEELKGLGRTSLPMKTDVTSAADVKGMVDRTRDVFGKIDILVNNAGMAAPPGMPFTNNTEEDWDRTFAVNTKSVFLTSKAIAPYFIERYGDAVTLVHLVRDPIRFAFSLAAHDFYDESLRNDDFTRLAALQPNDPGVRLRQTGRGLQSVGLRSGRPAAARGRRDG